MRALEDLWEEGKIRWIGVSNFGKQDMPDMLQVGRFESNQLPYNLLWRAIEFDIQPQCVEHNIGILPYSPLMQGLLTGKFRSPEDVPVDRARTKHYASIQFVLGARAKIHAGIQYRNRVGWNTQDIDIQANWNQPWAKFTAMHELNFR